MHAGALLMRRAFIFSKNFEGSTFHGESIYEVFRKFFHDGGLFCVGVGDYSVCVWGSIIDPCGYLFLSLCNPGIYFSVPFPKATKMSTNSMILRMYNFFVGQNPV